MGEKIQLTIAVPAYNAEQYIRKCLDSMVNIDSRLEIIVVDDGSTDGTGSIIEQYINEYPEQVRMIRKENGGHGSGINCAVAEASGRYFKVIDADDWIVTENLTTLLGTLAHTCADAVITGYRTINNASGKILSYSSSCPCAGKEIPLSQMLECYEEISSCCSFHGLMYRTDFYLRHRIILSEGIFYEDHEYATLPFAHVDTLLILPLFFYEYRTGNSGQSVSFQNQVKRIDHIEKVIQKILQYRKNNGPLREDREEYFLRKLSVVAVSYFAVALVKDSSRKTGREKARSFRVWLLENEPQLMNRITKKYNTLVLFHWIHFPPEIYQSVLDTAFYKKFRKLWTN